MTRINISPYRVVKLLMFIVVGLTFMHSILQVLNFGLGLHKLTIITSFFDFESDSNISTWYSSVTLLISSLLLIPIAIAKKNEHDTYARHWQFLVVIFAFLSLDEVAMLHERSGQVLDVLSPVEFDGWLYFQWVLIGIPITLIIAFAYLKFLAHLPTKTRNLFILAGALFTGGALGLEIIAGHEESLDSYNVLLYKLFTTIEELWEKLGVLVFIYALLSYIEKYVNQIQISIGKNTISQK
ncbi:MAG: hypothetical protein ACRC80_05530 [Waterburya sp.]